MQKRTFALALLAALLLAACASAAPKKLTVKDAWARPAAASETGAAYFVIDNRSGQEDTLLSASTDAAQAAELHMSSMDANGVMSMQHQEAVPVPDGGQVEFKPGGLHVMLVNLTKELKAGESFPLTLKFQHAGDVQVTVSVKEN